MRCFAIMPRLAYRYNLNVNLYNFFKCVNRLSKVPFPTKNQTYLQNWAGFIWHIACFIDVNITERHSYKTFYGRNLWIFMIS
jgi:hypothetical protein